MVSGGGQLPGSCHVLTRWKGQGSPLGSRSQGHTLRAESSQSPRLLVPPPWGPEKAVTCREEDWGGPGDPGPLPFRSWGGPAAPARTAQSRGHVSFKAMAEKPRGSHCPTGASASPTSSRAGGTPAAKPPCFSCFCWEWLPSGRSAPQTVTVSGSSSVCLGPGPTPRYAHTQGTQDPSAWREKPAPGRNGLEAARRPPWGRRCLGTGALARLAADMMGRPGGGAPPVLERCGTRERGPPPCSLSWHPESPCCPWWVPTWGVRSAGAERHLVDVSLPGALGRGAGGRPRALPRREPGSSRP